MKDEFETSGESPPFMTPQDVAAMLQVDVGGIARKQFYEYTIRAVMRAPKPELCPRPISSSGPLDPNYHASFIERDGLSIYMGRQTPEELRLDYVRMIRHERRAVLMSPLTLGRLACPGRPRVADLDRWLTVEALR